MRQDKTECRGDPEGKVGWSHWKWQEQGVEGGTQWPSWGAWSCSAWESAVGKMTHATQIRRPTWAPGLQLCNIKDSGISDQRPTVGAGQNLFCLPLTMSPGKTTNLFSQPPFPHLKNEGFDQSHSSQSRLGVRISRGILRKCLFLGPSPDQVNQNPDIGIFQKFPRWFYCKSYLRTTCLDHPKRSSEPSVSMGPWMGYSEELNFLVNLDFTTRNSFLFLFLFLKAFLKWISQNYLEVPSNLNVSMTAWEGYSEELGIFWWI